MKELTISSDAPGERLFVLGNEAIARGIIEAGVQVAAAYPGTPSSEILETLAGVAKEVDMYVEWSTNEKTAFEVALGASICGVRAVASMKRRMAIKGSGSLERIVFVSRHGSKA